MVPGLRKGLAEVQARPVAGVGAEVEADIEGENGIKKKKRARSSSVFRPDELLHLSSGRLRWPDQASSRQSIRHVGRAKTIQEQFQDRAFKDLLFTLLEHDPDKRITAADALQHRFFDRIRDKW